MKRLRGTVVDWDWDFREGTIRVHKSDGTVEDFFVDAQGIAPDPNHPGARSLRAGIVVSFETLLDWPMNRAINVLPLYRRALV